MADYETDEEAVRCSRLYRPLDQGIRRMVSVLQGLDRRKGTVTDRR